MVFDPKGLAVYIHWPFCAFKCPYCDFNSHVREKIDHADWLRGYKTELAHYREKSGARVISSVFFGGGTPSLMTPDTVGGVIAEIDKLWGIPQGTEITLEANPTSVETEKMKAFRAAGVNRVSLGVQALNDADLKKLGRQHSAAEAVAAVKQAASVFDRFSFDLIYARPDQTPEMWRAELKDALSFAAGHLSLYQLTIEKGTQYHTLFERGELVIPDGDSAATLYEVTQEMTEAAGLYNYEISNHARMGEESRHNLVYWRYGDYAGIGPGAHGRLTVDHVKYATRAHRAPEIWLERVAAHGHGAHAPEVVDMEHRGREMLMMGLRLAAGVDLKHFEQETGRAFLDFVNEKQARMLVDAALLTIDADTVTATSAGRQRLDAVLSFLLA